MVRLGSVATRDAGDAGNGSAPNRGRSLEAIAGYRSWKNGTVTVREDMPWNNTRRQDGAAGPDRAMPEPDYTDARGRGAGSRRVDPMP